VKNLYPDFIEFLTTLAENEVDFVIVGAYAVAFYGHARATKDMDVFVRAGVENAKRLYNALAKFGAPLKALDIQQHDLENYNGVFQLGSPPQRIDVITQISGVLYDEAVAKAKAFELNGKTIHVIGYDALITNKRASARLQDLADVEALTRLQKNSDPR
jgi:predicted nucleotidyltransferase